ncbi:L,D-transpeptidase family protein [Aurantimonas aggregata]|uniref:L,D-transpeptidase family protein n=1 Tax=Aurantimonas aggregata TaxID=2047720 RepID=A0A6L9MIB0_9HYPH|nr:L,D-transpeptidase family protein [Aurantimonas aggregata]NDV87438.1 L,D-transpeptidase family protein [Aurantimonas aggregata]
MRPKNRLIVVRRAPGAPQRGILSAGNLRLACALGRAGTTIFKREGDGSTPVATIDLISAWHRPGRMRLPATRLPVRRIRSGVDGWCDAPTHAAYNRPVRLPFPASAESMARADRLYDFVVVLDWNMRRRGRGRGSAIFLHIARPGYPPTAGCVAVSPADMQRLSPFLSPGTRLRVER